MEIILGIVALIFGWAILKMVLYRVFPEWGYKVAERRYQGEPDAVNERLRWEARSRVLAKHEDRDDTFIEGIKWHRLNWIENRAAKKLSLEQGWREELMRLCEIVRKVSKSNGLKMPIEVEQLRVGISLMDLDKELYMQLKGNLEREIRLINNINC
ncbi:MAG: hypothetical protein V7746_02840 [Halioglobus sp.]